MNIAYFEDDGTRNLLPLTWLRAAFELRCGRDRLIDKVRQHLGPHVAKLILRDALKDAVGERVPLDPVDSAAEWCLLSARAMVTGDVTPPRPGVAWVKDGELVAAGVTPSELEQFTPDFFQTPGRVDEWLRTRRSLEAPEAVRMLRYPWEPALLNAAELRRQVRNGNTAGREQDFPGVHLVRPQDVHLAANVRLKPGVVLDAEDGPVWIDSQALVEPNAVIQGPCYVGRQTVVRPGAALRGGVTIGPVCKVGGEIEASIFQGYANKQHDGFLGHSFVGEWVNLGADTVTSDLKNTYGTIRVSLNGLGIETGQHLVGSIIGDHSKTGIGTILPTGCVIGVAAHIFTHQSVPKYVPSFAWLTDDGLSACRLEKMLQIAQTVMARRDRELTPAERQVLVHVAAESRKTEAAGWGQK